MKLGVWQTLLQLYIVWIWPVLSHIGDSSVCVSRNKVLCDPCSCSKGSSGAFLSSSHRAQGLALGYLWATYQLLPTLESRDLRISGHQLRYGTAFNSLRTAWTCTGQGMCLSSFLASPLLQTTDSCPLENAISICFLVTWEACVWSAWISCDSYNYSSVLFVAVMVIMSILLDRATQMWCIHAHTYTLVEIQFSVKVWSWQNVRVQWACLFSLVCLHHAQLCVHSACMSPGKNRLKLVTMMDSDLRQPYPRHLSLRMWKRWV